MDKFIVEIEIRENSGESASAKRVYISAQHSASFGWCAGQTLAGALASLRECLTGPDETLKDAASGFADGIAEILRSEA